MMGAIIMYRSESGSTGHSNRNVLLVQLLVKKELIDQVLQKEQVMPIITIEPEGINAFTADGQWEEIELSVDSGRYCE